MTVVRQKFAQSSAITWKRYEMGCQLVLKSLIGSKLIIWASDWYRHRWP